MNFLYVVSLFIVAIAVYECVQFTAVGGEVGATSGSSDRPLQLSIMQKTTQRPSSQDNDASIATTPTPSVMTHFELPVGFRSMLERAKEMKGKCNVLPSVNSELNEIDLPAFGLIDALETYRPQSVQEVRDWNCELPPPTECDVERFSVIFLGYSQDRLSGMKNQFRAMLRSSPYRDMVEEIVLVWNNPKPLNESGSDGEYMYQWSLRETDAFDETEPNRFRVFYPIEHGLSSSLMNRYHPMIKPKSKALLYYDDDGPFYHERVIRSNFELWKRNSNVQTGAMARAFTLSTRQQKEKDEMLGGAMKLDDRKFISHCRENGDKIVYDFRYFENFHANMVLPSGSMIHRNYLCFIWHPALAELRRFVHDHLVHPDDMTVSTIVSHLSGRAPKPYSRRLPEQRRRLQDSVNGTSPAGMWRTKDWGNLRSIALNSVVSYFGAINSGSYGWCYKTEYHRVQGRRQICDPEMARMGMLPWMQIGGAGNDLCPVQPSPNSVTV